MRRLPPILVLAVLVCLAGPASPALAQIGVGRGTGEDFIPVSIGVIVICIGLAIVTFRYQRRRRARDTQVRAAAAEVAEEDPAFAEDAVRAETVELFHEVQDAWDKRDLERLAGIAGPEQVAEWTRRLDDLDRRGLRHRVWIQEQNPLVEYVGLANRERDEDDRVIVRIEAQVRTWVEDAFGRAIRLPDDEQTALGIRTPIEERETMLLAEYWTLAKRGGRWIVWSIEQQAEGDRHLERRLVTEPWSDQASLSDETPFDGYKPAYVAPVDFHRDARTAALDLARADARFAPYALEAAARRAVEAWVRAVEGEDGALEAVAGPEAVAELLGDRARLIVRNPLVRRIHIVALDSNPVTMSVEVELGGWRYTEDRDTGAVLSGSREVPTTFTERWTFVLEERERDPWRVAGATAPAASPRQAGA